MTELSPRENKRSTKALVVCTSLGVLGTLVSIACILALYLEMTDFTGPRDKEIRIGYVLTLTTVAGLAILIPALSVVVLRPPKRIVVAVSLLCILVELAVFGVVAVFSTS